MKTPIAVIQDHPAVVTGGVVGVVLLHLLATRFWGLPDVWAGVESADQSLTTTLYLALLGPAAIVAGFAGVVIIFGLQSDSPRFRTFRLAGGASLTRNWSATAMSGFEAAAASAAAAILAIAGISSLAPWIFEIAIFWLAHGTIRLIWILRGLIRTVRASDIDANRKANQKSLDSFGFRKTS